MKNRAFVNILISVIVWMLILFTLQCLFSGYTKEFGLACSMCFLSIFFLFSYKNALKPTETVGPYNPTKKRYEENGDLPGYQRLCKIMFLVGLSISAISFLKGSAEVVIFFIKQAAST